MKMNVLKMLFVSWICLILSNGWASEKIDISHTIMLFPQPTDMSCWAAAASMVVGNRCVGSGDAQTDNKGGLTNDYKNIEKFGKANGLKMQAFQTFSVQGLADLLKKSPLWVGGIVSDGHAYVIGAMKGDGTADKTMITIYDPWPPGKGEIKKVSYGAWMKEYPLSTIYILHK